MDANQGQATQTRGEPAHNFVHLHFQKRNARQCLTSVRGLPEDLDMKKLTRHFKKAWCCNGTTTKHSNGATSFNSKVTTVVTSQNSSSMKASAPGKKSRSTVTELSKLRAKQDIAGGIREQSSKFYYVIQH